MRFQNEASAKSTKIVQVCSNQTCEFQWQLDEHIVRHVSVCALTRVFFALTLLFENGEEKKKAITSWKMSMLCENASRFTWWCVAMSPILYALVSVKRRYVCLILHLYSLIITLYLLSKEQAYLSATFYNFGIIYGIYQEPHEEVIVLCFIHVLFAMLGVCTDLCGG